MRTATLGLTTALAAMLACSSAVPQDDPQLSLTIELKPGPPVGTPLADVIDAAPQSTLKQGYPIAAVFTVTNEGDEARELRAMEKDLVGGTGDYGVEVFDAQGRAVPEPLGGHTGGPEGSARRCKLAPGEAYVHAIHLNHCVVAPTPGTYSAAGTVDARRRTSTVTLRSAPVDFVITPTSDAEMAEYINELVDELTTEDEAQLEQAIKYLAYTGHKLAIPRLVDALYRLDLRQVRVPHAFRYLDPDASKAALLEALRGRGPSPMGGYLLRRVYEVPKADMVDAVLAGLQHTDPDRRADGARELRHYTEFEDQVIAPLLHALNDNEPQVRSAAALSLASFADPRIEAALLAASHDGDAATRQSAVTGLKACASDESIARLREMVLDEPDVAEASIEALRDIGTPEAVNALRAGLENADEKTRLRAAAALVRSGDNSARPFLADALDGADQPMSLFLMSLLGEALWKADIPGPGEDGDPWCSDPKRWLEWLRAAE